MPARDPDLLIVDDDPDAAEALAEAVRSRGFHARVAADGQAGLAAVSERLPDLILLDVEMPHLDGPGMAAELFVENVGREQIPIILTSGVRDLEAVVARVGTPYYLQKPFRFASLIEMIARALAEQTPPRPSAARI